MSLKIVSSNDPIEVKQIVLCVYGLPGVGKTTLANTSEKPLVLDFDRGVYRSLARKDSVIISEWGEIAAMSATDLAPYSTIVVDTAGRALDTLTLEIIRQNPKMARGSGALTLQGYGALKSEFGAWLKRIKSFGKDVVLLAHMDEQRDGDSTIERLDVQGGSKAEIYKSADAMAKLYIANNERRIDFSPREGSLGKNPAQFDILPVPNVLSDSDFLSNLISQIKSKLNDFGEKQRTRKREVEEWRKTVHAADSLEQFNGLLDSAHGRSPIEKKLLMNRASDFGLSYDREAKQFREKGAA